MKEKIGKGRKLKRLLSVVLAVAMVVTLMPMNSLKVYAATSCSGSGHDHTYVISGEGNERTITISGSGELKSTCGFAYADGIIQTNSIKKVVIGGGLTIGDLAFCNCSGLTSVTISSGVTFSGVQAFQNCSGLTSVTLPSDLTTIGGSAFSGCSGLTSITIPSSVTAINNYAFSGCSGLTSITIPSSVTTIGNEAFDGCSGLTSIVFESNTLPETLGSWCFNKTQQEFSLLYRW